MVTSSRTFAAHLERVATLTCEVHVFTTKSSHTHELSESEPLKTVVKHARPEMILSTV